MSALLNGHDVEPRHIDHSVYMVCFWQISYYNTSNPFGVTVTGISAIRERAVLLGWTLCIGAATQRHSSLIVYGRRWRRHWAHRRSSSGGKLSFRLLSFSNYEMYLGEPFGPFSMDKCLSLIETDTRAHFCTCHLCMPKIISMLKELIEFHRHLDSL